MAVLRRVLAFRRFVIPVATFAGLTSIFHYLIERFPNMTSAACDPTNPCSITWVWSFHFISIPFMALSGFALIIALLALGEDSAPAGAKAWAEAAESTPDELESPSADALTGG